MMETTAATADVTAVADSFVYLMRTFARQRAKVLAEAAHDVEWSSQLLLKVLANEGAMRASQLAEHAHIDPSTASRQVAALVKEGMVERRADPEDGRACLLAITDKAGDVLRRHDEIRDEYFTRMLSGWSERDLRRFATLLSRFTADFDAASTDFLTERIATRTASAERT
ncbi:MAG: MarR family transcriptional regulator [Jatrophihabitans sp.]|nr:MAG: MarR family transcriptional regulator [Jatrophihabitans sp.]